MIKKIIVSVLSFLFFITAGCGEDLPFEYKYTSANVVMIKYKGSIYELDRFGMKTAAPFTYRFEPDGDLDIMIDGKVYDIDSPYDLDKPKVSKKKRKSKRRTKKR